MIHQELQQVPELTVAQNMFLGRPLISAGGMLVKRDYLRVSPVPDAKTAPDQIAGWFERRQ